MRCYNCGAELGKGDNCQNCGTNVKVYKKILMASNAYYNDALEKAGVRDLSGAIESLKISLRFNKLNIDARNLLGLIYYEMGEVVTALTEWVISKNYQPKDNLASRYLDEVQKNQVRLDSVNQTIKKYNQALLYCKQNSRDLAIIQLKKVLSLNPKLVSGHQLLALLYIQEGRYDLAKKSLRNAGKIDANNTVTLRYLKEANAALREQNPSKKQKNDELISYQSGNETIIQPKYLKDNSAVGTIINMVIGIAIGIAITCFLVVPGVRRTVMNNTKAEVLDANNTISSKNQTITSLQSQVDDLTSQITDAKNSEEESANKLESYDKLLTAYETYTTGDIEKAGDALSSVNVDDLSADAKERIKNSLQKAKNSFKEMFVRDYVIWVLFEGSGSPRLNKVARKILFTYCPFPAALAKTMEQNPTFSEMLARQKVLNGQRLHHLDTLRQKLRNSDIAIPPTLDTEYAYTKGEV